MTSQATVPFVVLGNGPGEIAGWALPIALEARRQAAAKARRLDMTLCLPPCQGASGQEATVARGAGVFDHIVGPAIIARASLGLPAWTPPLAPILLHVGGGFWYTQRLTRRWHARAFAFVERTHVAGAHGTFERIFVPTLDLADRLKRDGVPAAKILVVGDPRHDTLPARLPSADRNGNGTTPQITMLCGSRNAIFTALFPFWLQTAAALRSRLPDARVRLVVSPYIAPGVRDAVIARHRATLNAARIDVAHGGWSHILDADIVLTIPGTNTMELAIMRMPAIVVLPFDLAPLFAVEGIIEWILRLLPFGGALKRLLVPAYVRRMSFVALPNLVARRRVMPEMVGEITPAQVAAETVRLLGDDAARRRLVEDLMVIPDEAGASERVVSALGMWGNNA
jgi:lipid-A-disaccharide synthase